MPALLVATMVIVSGALVAFLLVAAFVVWRRIRSEPMLPLTLIPALLPAGHLVVYVWAVPVEAGLLELLVSLVPLDGQNAAKNPRVELDSRQLNLQGTVLSFVDALNKSVVGLFDYHGASALLHWEPYVLCVRR